MIIRDQEVKTSVSGQKVSEGSLVPWGTVGRNKEENKFLYERGVGNGRVGEGVQQLLNVLRGVQLWARDVVIEVVGEAVQRVGKGILVEELAAKEVLKADEDGGLIVEDWVGEHVHGDGELIL